MEASEESLPYYKLDVPFSGKRFYCIECVESRHKYISISLEAAGAYAASSALIINKFYSSLKLVSRKLNKTKYQSECEML